MSFLRRVLPFLLIFCLLAGCAPKQAERTIFAMDTVMTLRVYGKDAEAGVQAAVQRINELEKLLSVTREDSRVWQLNHAGGQPVAVEEDLLSLLRTAQEVGDATGGALDVTLYPVLRSWGFTTDAFQVPSQEKLTELLNDVNYKAVQLDGSSVTLPEGAELDFGALAKGYAGEVCAQLLRERGITSALLMLGGNIQTVGSSPDGSPWTIGVQDPGGEEGALLGTVELEDRAAVTSGGYQRYFEEDGVRYWHILDPKTGKPARSGLVSVTVVGQSGALCDALSTALFVLGREEALDYWRSHRDLELILVDEDMGLWVTAGLASSFVPAEGSAYTLHIVED